MWKYLAGIRGALPINVSTVRASIEAAAIAGIGYYVTEFQAVDWREYTQFAPLVFGFLRGLEGFADEVIDADQNRTGIPSGAVDKYLRGIGKVGPAAVAFARASLEVGVLAGLGHAVTLLEGVTWGDYAIFAPAIIWGVRQAEGLADQVIDPSQNRRTPDPVPA